MKEIYDRRKELELDPRAVVFNQFSEFGNHLVHEVVTGRALARVVDHLRVSRPGLRVAAFVSATGSAGTIAAGDHLKERDGAQIVAVEALECPTLTENGFGEHNIQGIGDKHVPLIHNVMNTDAVVAISDGATDQLNVLFNTRVGRDYLAGRRGVPLDVVEALDSFGLSSICNVLAAVRYARSAGLGPDDLIVTVATDGAGMYDRARQGRATRFRRLLRRHGGGRSLRGSSCSATGSTRSATDRPGPAADLQPWVLHVGGAAGDRTRRVRRTSVADVLDGPARAGPAWDELIGDFNARARPGEHIHPGSAAGRRGGRAARGDPDRVHRDGCGYVAPRMAAIAQRCPASVPGDDIDHVLRRVIDTDRVCFPRTPRGAGEPLRDVPRAVPLVPRRARDRLVGRRLCRAGARPRRERRGDRGHGFRPTPLRKAHALAERLGMIGALFVKDETGNVAGSHKARHLMGTALELELAAALRRSPIASVRPLAIASCGNAALAAVVAAAWGRTLLVFVPPDADQTILTRLRELPPWSPRCPVTRPCPAIPPTTP